MPDGCGRSGQSGGGGLRNEKRRVVETSAALVLLWGIMAATNSGAATYYVDAARGDDANAGLVGGELFPAYKTIQKAAGAVSAGDTCLVAPGAYNERVRIAKSGTAAAPITFKANGPGTIVRGFTVRGDGTTSYVVIEGFEITMPREAAFDKWDTGSGVSLIDTRHCEVRNNHIHHTLREGIMIFTYGGADSSNSRGNVISGNTIEYAGAYAGITVNGADQIIERNDISHTIQHPLYPVLSTAGKPDADGIKFCGKGHVFRCNTIHDITLADKGNVNPHTDGFQTFGPAYNIVIERNNINLPTDAPAYQGAMISQAVQPVSNLTFRNNVITAYRGLNVWGVNDATKAVVPLPRVKILNNTFYNVQNYDIELHDCPESVVKNNAISASGRYLFANCHPDVGYNGVPGALPLFPDDKRVAGFGYADAAHRDFHLKQGSPLIASGIDAGATSDFDGTPAPPGARPAIGAFEFVSAAASGSR